MGWRGVGLGVCRKTEPPLGVSHRRYGHSACSSVLLFKLLGAGGFSTLCGGVGWGWGRSKGTRSFSKRGGRRVIRSTSGAPELWVSRSCSFYSPGLWES